jgi:hypothetical protein
MPRPWHRSPVLWFGLPGLIFLIAAWVDSMSWNSRLELSVADRRLSCWNHGSRIGVGFYQNRNLLLGSSGKTWDLQPSRDPTKDRSWFPLASYMSNDGWSYYRSHAVAVPHWFVILVYLGLWQLPWLFRYHRRRQIGRSLTSTSPAQPQTDLDLGT